MKFSLTALPESYTLPGRPAAPPAAADAHKQTQFLLGDELALFEMVMNLQLTLVAANKRARTQETAALLSFWSRTFSHLADACDLMSTGSYVSCPPLLRAALDCLAAQRSLVRDGFGEYEEWFQGASSQAKEHQALSLDLGRYRAGSVLAEDERLGLLCRLLSDLSMPHFGSTALLVGPELGLTTLTASFADRTFHLGLAQLFCGWLILLADKQLHTALASSVFAASDEIRAQAERASLERSRLLSDSRRCRTEEVDGRFLLLNFRRTASGQPRRLIL